MKNDGTLIHKDSINSNDGIGFSQIWRWVTSQPGYAGFVGGVLALAIVIVFIFRNDISIMLGRLTPESILVVLIIVLIIGAIIVVIALLLAYLWYTRQPLKVTSSDDKIEKPTVQAPATLPVKQDIYPIDAKLHHFISPLHPPKFYTLTLPKQGPFQAYGREYAPSGIADFGGIPFILERIEDGTGQSKGHRIIDLMPGSADNAPAEMRIPANLANITKVHFLLTAGNGRAKHLDMRFQDKSIGYIEFVYVGGQSHREMIVLGKNIREWAYGNDGDLVRTIDPRFAKPIWIASDYSCLLDAVPIELGSAPGLHLDYIRVVAVFQETHAGHMKPTIRLSAITCERY